MDKLSIISANRFSLSYVEIRSIHGYLISRLCLRDTSYNEADWSIKNYQPTNSRLYVTLYDGNLIDIFRAILNTYQRYISMINKILKVISIIV